TLHVAAARGREAALFGPEHLHQRAPEPLNERALDLAVMAERVDDRADVVRRREAAHGHVARLRVDRDLRHLGREGRDRAMGLRVVEMRGLQASASRAAARAIAASESAGTPSFAASASICALSFSAA